MLFPQKVQRLWLTLAISVQANGKGDIAKWGQLDAASSNYNVVVLGAALIANELGSSKVVNVKSADMEIATFDLNGDVVNGKPENDAGVLRRIWPILSLRDLSHGASH